MMPINPAANANPRNASRIPSPACIGCELVETAGRGTSSCATPFCPVTSICTFQEPRTMIHKLPVKSWGSSAERLAGSGSGAIFAPTPIIRSGRIFISLTSLETLRICTCATPGTTAGGRDCHQQMVWPSIAVKVNVGAVDVGSAGQRQQQNKNELKESSSSSYSCELDLTLRALSDVRLQQSRSLLSDYLAMTRDVGDSTRDSLPPHLFQPVAPVNADPHAGHRKQKSQAHVAPELTPESAPRAQIRG